MKSMSALLVLLCAFISSARGMCFDDAARRYDVPAQLLKLIAEVESDMNPTAINRNEGGSEDIGVMQINTGWLPVLKKFGINREDLFDACTNVMVGAWVLHQNIERYGYTWEAIGAYNARSAEKRFRYIKRVYARLKRGETQNG